MAATESVSRPVLLHRRPDDTRRRPSQSVYLFLLQAQVFSSHALRFPGVSPHSSPTGIGIAAADLAI